jgi:hypothetical protein
MKTSVFRVVPVASFTTNKQFTLSESASARELQKSGGSAPASVQSSPSGQAGFVPHPRLDRVSRQTHGAPTERNRRLIELMFVAFLRKWVS